MASALPYQEDGGCGGECKHAKVLASFLQQEDCNAQAVVHSTPLLEEEEIACGFRALAWKYCRQREKSWAGLPVWVPTVLLVPKRPLGCVSEVQDTLPCSQQAWSLPMQPTPSNKF